LGLWRQDKTFDLPGLKIADRFLINSKMEVHHHTSHDHSSAGATHRKTWKQHVWEFFMLFLAVTLGFFVENQREHYIEHQREKLYMRSMKEDLVKDTAMLKSVIQRTRSVMNHIDSALIILETGKPDSKSIADLYRINLSLLSNTSPAFIDRTTVQLRNAGAMRLIRNSETVDSIINYWSQLDNTKNISEQMEDYKSKARDLSYTIFDQRFYRNQQQPVFIAGSDLRLTELANRIAHIKNLNAHRYITALNHQVTIAINLIETINKNYK
jgi:hypothetical protein